MCHIECSQPVMVGVDQLRALFWDILAWQQVWNPIEQVQLLYDDGRNQEFVMQVWRDGAMETVRTIRYLGPDGAISFFSPQPPPMMRAHRGAWVFRGDQRRAVVTAVRDYELSPRPGEAAQQHELRSLAFKASFTTRLEQILSRFADHFALVKQEVLADGNL